MAWFGQGKDTIEWEEFRDDVLFFKWPANEIKKGAKLIIRQGQKAVFFANGKVEGVFEEPGSFDIMTQIMPFLSTLKGWGQLRGDTGMRAEIYFVNAKELLLPWGTRQRIMIPSPEVPSGVPIGCNGNMIVEFRNYLKFITNVAGVKASYSLGDIAERIMGELSPIIAECILGGERSVGLNALIDLQGNSRALGKKLRTELDKELMDFGLGVKDLNILSINYPTKVQTMAEKVAAQSFVGNVGRYAAVSMADSFGNSGDSGIGSMGAQMAMGAAMAQQMMGTTGCDMMPQAAQAPQQSSTVQMSNRFCPTCRKMVNGRFCPDCGTATV